MSWRAVFVDGPLAGVDHDRMFMGSWQTELYFAPSPPGVGDGFMLVGTDAFNVGWPDAIRYVRNDERSSLLKDEGWTPGEDEGFAVFEIAVAPA